MNKEQIIAALVPLYNAAYDDYYRLLQLSTQMLHEDEDQAYRAIVRVATQKSHFIDGIKEAADALGISATELLTAAVAQNKRKRIQADGAARESEVM